MGRKGTQNHKFLVFFVNFEGAKVGLRNFYCLYNAKLPNVSDMQIA